jgi:NAD(P)-dependent dehydrogenase (short-subunit alcohol dehydrogenase family)
MNRELFAKQFDISGRTYVIPGGGGILGSEIGCALAAIGANVVVLDHRPSRAVRIKERIQCGPGRTQVLYGDVLDPASLEKAREAICAEFGRIDGVINAAGGNHPQATTRDDLSFFDLSPAGFRQVVDLNLLGVVFSCQVFGRVLAEQAEGVIINFSSMNAYRPLTRVPAYSAGKAALTNFTQWLAVHMAQEYSPHIRVNAIAPGFFHTSQNHYLLYDEATGNLTVRGQAILDHTPMRRFGEPADLIGTLFWLLSPAAAFVTGIVVPVDGGFSAYSGV